MRLGQASPWRGRFLSPFPIRVQRRIPDQNHRIDLAVAVAPALRPLSIEPIRSCIEPIAQSLRR